MSKKVNLGRIKGGKRHKKRWVETEILVKLCVWDEIIRNIIKDAIKGEPEYIGGIVTCESSDPSVVYE